MKVKTKNPDRGPLLIVSGAEDHAGAVGGRQLVVQQRERRNKEAVTEIVKLKDHGHTLTIDHGWQKVADTSLKFLQRFVKP